MANPILGGIKFTLKLDGRVSKSKKITNYIPLAGKR
jgi:hypothetical protein